MRICSKGIWDETIPGISFDEMGVSNYCRLQEKMMNEYPRGQEGHQNWLKIVQQIKDRGRGGRYDCVVGVSGGVDSSFLLKLCNEHGLRVLAVHLDNGFNSEISVDNIHKITTQLQIDLMTYVINYEEMKDLLLSYMKAGMPWIDAPTDLAIKASMYIMAQRHGIKYILRGNDFRSEGKQPTEWTYTDSRQLRFIHQKFGSGIRLRNYPVQTIPELVISGFIRGIKDVRPYYYIDYNKQEAKKLLTERFAWRDYGGHHHENLFTKFAMAYWLPHKFGIDKRKINLSAQVLSGAIERNEALRIISEPFDSPENLQDLKQYIVKKLGLDDQKFSFIWSGLNHNFKDYPSNYNLIYNNVSKFSWLVKKIFDFKPMSIDSKKIIK